MKAKLEIEKPPKNQQYSGQKLRCNSCKNIFDKAREIFFFLERKGLQTPISAINYVIVWARGHPFDQTTVPHGPP